MNNLEILENRGTYAIPYINLDAQTGECIVEGESFIEDTLAFYEPVIKWVKEFCQTKNTPIHFTFKLTYYNTSSSKSFFEIIQELKKYKDAGNSVKLDWHYPEDDDSIKEEGEDFKRFIKIDIDLHPFKEDEY